ncbi:unnamed protein product [Kuraishia capsulata CBS 1993]|uniref:Sm domain-containing protein n=1 Tax=Kuraishia capsulata CBS 1993 TaxID=1382522 RepID=W6MVH5_9ASCO|nr:uncharacterized protein KUCA_T00002256001 [Kuraishia capsulata CBS 1993]CDK26285.1 unnamed protein product [Kuraishia capsulata CBS 1993]
MSFQPINPKPFLNSLVDKKVVVKLKFNKIEYHGKLISVDNYMNLLLDEDTLEYDLSAKGKTQGEILATGGTPLKHEIFIRCNNVLWIGEDVAEAVTAEAVDDESMKE